MLRIKCESVLSPTIQIRNKKLQNEEVEIIENYSIGTKYSDFNMLEPFILEYDIDLSEVKKGDIIIRDWQYGHLKNTGYIPLKVTDTFDGMNITVETTDGRLRRIVADTNNNHGEIYHKLDKSYMK